MYSSEDLESFYFQYQTEALLHGESLQLFCVKNKVPYNIFQKWFKDTYKKVVEVQVDSALKITNEKENKTDDQLNLYQKAVITIPFAYGLTFVSVTDYTCHSVIGGMVKLHGSFVWNFIETFSRISLTDAGFMLTWCLYKITLATSQC